MVLRAIPAILFLTLLTLAGVYFWLIPGLYWPSEWEFIPEDLTKAELRSYSPWVIPGLCLVQLLPWLRFAQFKPSLDATAALLSRAIPVYLGIMFLLFGIGLFPMAAISNDGVAKISAALERGEVTSRREALARLARQTISNP